MNLDEWFDSAFCRPLARPLARGLARTPATANQVTFVSALFGIASGALYSMPGRAPVAGALVLLVMMVLDCTDGELARLRGGGSWRGRVIDGLGDLTCAFSVHLGMLVHLITVGVTIEGYRFHPVELFAVALAAGVSMSWNSAVLDDLKQRLKPTSVDRDLDRYAAEVSGPWDRFLFWFLRNYVAKIGRAGSHGQTSYPFFRRVQWVGPTHHHLWMVIAGLAVPFFPLAFFGYFVWSLIPANLYLATLLRFTRGDEGSVPVES